MQDADASKLLQSNLSLLAVPALSTPIDAFHAYVIRALQTQGFLCFPILPVAPRKPWLSDESWQIHGTTSGLEASESEDA